MPDPTSAPAPLPPQALAPTPLHRNRDYQRLWLAHALSGFGSQASAIALPLVVLHATGSVTAFGLVTFTEILASVLAGLPAGVLVDRLPRKLVLIISDVARALAYLVMTAAVLTDRVSLPLALCVAVVNSVFSAPFNPAASAALRHVVPREQLPAALSLSQARSAAVTLAGPLIGAALYTVAPALPFLVDALSYLASTVCVALVRLPAGRPTTTTAPPAPSLVKDLGTGWREVRRSPFLRYTLVNAALVNLAFSGIVLVLVAGGAHAASGGFHNAVIIAASGAGNLVGSLIAARTTTTLPPRTLVLLVCWSTALFTPLLALSDNTVALALVIGACSLATPAANAVISAARLHAIPDHLQGRVQTACGLIPALIIPFGPLLTSTLLAHTGPATVLLANSALLLALACYSTLSPGLRLIPDLRPRKPAPHPAPAPAAPAPDPAPAPAKA
ncbi:MFS transporter [Streptomyces roseolus]|uniref:MFS transporter n=1 Tax=Streptomyces roseolus TaxID=67358 RepID=UPI0016730743|nr:MFS transporter [Streptomyces roseolus]GGR65033.1 MFS transporter [Streptomyces roseolus]